MNRTQNIAFLGDIHISFTIWERYRQITGDSQFALNEMIRTCDENGIQHLVLLGDIFDTPDPHPALVKMFREFIDSCACAGISLYCIQGNHDRRVVPWPTAISDDLRWIGDGNPVEIAGTTVVGFDYQNRDAIAESLSRLGAQDIKVDVLCMHQAAKQYLDIEGCWNVDLEWVPDNVKDIFLGDIHDPCSGEVDSHRWFYTGASHTRSITEAKHAKSLLVRTPEGEVSRLQFRCRPIKSFAMDGTNKDVILAEIRNWLYEKIAQEPPLPPVIYLTHDVSFTAAPELVDDIIKSAKGEAFLFTRSVGSRQGGGVEFDVAAALDDVPSVQGFIPGFFDPEKSPLEHGLALDLLDGTAGKEGINAKIEHARLRFLQNRNPSPNLPVIGPDHFKHRDAVANTSTEDEDLF